MCYLKDSETELFCPRTANQVVFFLSFYFSAYFKLNLIIKIYRNGKLQPKSKQNLKPNNQTNKQKRYQTNKTYLEQQLGFQEEKTVVFHQVTVLRIAQWWHLVEELLNLSLLMSVVRGHHQRVDQKSELHHLELW